MKINGGVQSILLLICLNLKLISCVDQEITVSIEAGREDCFYEHANAGEIIDIEYQVIDGGHGDLDITFRIVHPSGRIIVADFKKSENNHRVKAHADGDYRFCFDNTFSSFNTKTVFMELIIENENEDDGVWDSKDIDAKPEDVNNMKLEDFVLALNNIRNHITKVRHLQEMIKSAESRDRNTAEENYFKVNTVSMIQIFIMLSVGILQVIMVKSLFDDKSRIHKLWLGVRS